MQLDTALANGLYAVRDASPSSAARARPPALASTTGDAQRAPPTLAVAPPIRKSPPRLNLGAAVTHSTERERLGEEEAAAAAAAAAAGPALTVQPASPAMCASPTSTSPFPAPVASTSSHSPQTPYAPSFQPPPTPVANGGGLAARRAAKLGKKRLSLVVPANPHSSLPSAGVNGPSATLLSPVTPSFLRPSSGGSHLDAETRSLPPSPVLLTTFIGAEGSEAPDRTIGRLMLKQQADEMREQMRGGRGMKRRTSIPRLNLVRGGAPAHPASLDPTAPPVERVATPSGAHPGGATSAVQLIRGDAVERGVAADGEEAVEEFPYANGPREILPGVFLGSEQNAKDARVLRDWRIGFVLNVAKEVECPWTEEDNELLPEARAATPLAAPPQESAPTARLSPPRAAEAGKLRRAKTQAGTAVPSPAPGESATPSGTSTPQPPVRPPFMRPTASTPNLHAVFHPPSPPVPAVPAIPPSFLPSPPDSDPMLRSLSSSPPSQPSRRLSRQSARRSGGSGGGGTPAAPTASTSTAASSCPGSVRYSAQALTGRPELEYLWLKWGHDEADLVEAHKFQAAFAFLDAARERGERVLVHCQCGVSRSATVVIAYCMREAARALEEGRDAQELAGCTGMHDTYSFVKEKSEWVGPNLSLVFQLVAYERTLRGDSAHGEEGDEPPYPHYPPEPSSARPADNDDDDDLPPPTPAVGFSPFAFPPPVAPPRPASFANGIGTNPLPSPRTPSSSDNSLAESQLSTPDLAHTLDDHDPLVSPALSCATKASSVASTPHSTAERLGLPRGGAVRIVEGDDPDEAGAGDRGRHSSLETVVAGGIDEGKYPRAGDKGVFVLPVPPRSHYAASLQDAVSPTVALYPPGVQQQQQQQPPSSLPPPPTASRLVSPPQRTSSLARTGPAPPLTLQLPSPPSSAPRALPAITTATTTTSVTTSPRSPAQRASLIPLQLSSPRAGPGGPPSLTSPTSPASTLSAASPATLVSALSFSSSSSSSSTASSTLSLSRTNSARGRFGTNQTASQRRASHRRVCSDTIRVPAVGGMQPLSPSTAGAGGSRPGSPAVGRGVMATAGAAREAPLEEGRQR